MSLAEQWVEAVMKRIRWDKNPRRSYEKQVIKRVADIRAAPNCSCGASMRERAGYLMGGSGDWIGYECPNDRPWNFWKHSPWTTQIGPGFAEKP